MRIILIYSTSNCVWDMLPKRLPNWVTCPGLHCRLLLVTLLNYLHNEKSENATFSSLCLLSVKWVLETKKIQEVAISFRAGDPEKFWERGAWDRHHCLWQPSLSWPILLKRCRRACATPWISHCFSYTFRSFSYIFYFYWFILGQTLLWKALIFSSVRLWHLAQDLWYLSQR